MQYSQHRHTQDDGSQRKLDTRRLRRGSKLIGSKNSRGVTRRGSIINHGFDGLRVVVASYNRQGRRRHEVLHEFKYGATFAEVAQEYDYGHDSWVLPKKQRSRRHASIQLVALPQKSVAVGLTSVLTVPVSIKMVVGPTTHHRLNRLDAPIRTSCRWMGDLGRCQNRSR